MLGNIGNICLYAANISSSGAQFLRLGIGARANAMGDAYTAVSEGADSVYWNAASLSKIKNKEAMFMHASWFAGIEYGFMSFVTPLANNSGFGCAVQYVNYGTLDRLDKDGSSNGTFAPADKLISVSYGQDFEIVSVGVTGKYIDSVITKNAKTYAFDAGLNYDFSKSVKLGVALRNMGQGLKYKEQRDQLPTSLDIGASCDLNEDLLMALETKFSKDNDMISSIGFEYKANMIKDMDTAVRMGYTNRTKDVGNMLGVSFGFGIVYKKYKIDYSYTPSGELDNTQMITLGIIL